MNRHERLKFFIIIIIAISLRFFWLNKIPIGITGDELDYLLNAKAVFLTGKDMSGAWSPFSLSTPPYEVPKGELLYLLYAPFIGITSFSLLTARIPSAIISVLFVLVIYLITRQLMSKKTAFVAGLVMAINPWSIYFGRTAYEVPIALFFYFFAFYILLIAKSWKIFLAFPILFVAFFLYIGTKIIFPFFVVIVLFFNWSCINKKRFTRQYVLLLILSLLTFVSYILLLKEHPVSTRLSDLRTPFQPKIASTVDFERRLTIQTPFTNVVSNKLTIFLRESISMYLKPFSADFLFVSGEQSAFISLWNQGLFYYIDFFFLIIGFLVLYSRNRRTWLLFTSLIFISPLPAVASKVGESYSIRSSLMYPIIVILIGLGITTFIAFIKGKPSKYIAALLIISSYIILLLNFLNNYFFRFPIYNSESFGLSHRIIAKYIKIAEKYNKEVIIVQPSDNLITSAIFRQYLFYNNVYNMNTSSEIKRLINNKIFSYKNIRITNCTDYSNTNNSIVITESGHHCKKINNDPYRLSISRLGDGGEIYKIFNDNICSRYKLKRYPQKITMHDLDIEKLPEDKFCKTFITSFNKKIALNFNHLLKTTKKKSNSEKTTFSFPKI